MRKKKGVRIKRGLLAFIALLFASATALAGEYRLVIDETRVNITGQERMAMTINGTAPGPALRWREGEEVTLRVTNRLMKSARRFSG
ncbi:MAG: multicopper oxidase domain-containing protein [Nitrospirae bacterium]|nr:multicopper oxidase domain-containing protein [Candidatus Manganitrophaceae bacterium]